MGLMLAAQDLPDARGAGLLYAANLLGILIGGIIVLAIREPLFPRSTAQKKTVETSSPAGVGVTVSRRPEAFRPLQQYLYNLKRTVVKERIEADIRTYLKRGTVTFGANDALDLGSIDFDWPDYWQSNRSPTLEVVVRVTDPTTPSYKQVQEIQTELTIVSERSFRAYKFKCGCKTYQCQRGEWR